MAACMPWFKVHAGWSSHPKVGRLCDVLESDFADVYVGRLWDYCAERQGDGHFPMPGAAGAVERAVRWTGARGALASAMVAVGLLDKAEDGALTVHDWVKEQKAVAEKFSRDRERRRAEREEGRAGVARPARDSLSTLYSPVSTSQLSDVSSTSPSAEHKGVSAESRDPRAAVPAPVALATPEDTFAPPPPAGSVESLPDGVDRVHRAVKGTPYALSPADVHATRQLLALANGSVPELLRRWENGLRATYGQRVNTLAKLADREKWEGNLHPEKGREAKPASVTRGSVPAKSAEHSKTGELEF